MERLQGHFYNIKTAIKLRINDPLKYEVEKRDPASNTLLQLDYRGTDDLTIHVLSFITLHPQ